MELQSLAEDLQRRFDHKMAAREKALPAARRAIRASANAIRAIHRGELDQADRLLEEASRELRTGRSAVQEHPDVRHAGFLHDAEKEYAEARLTEATIAGKDLPTAEELEVTPAAYLNGMAETIGEARRAVLDLLRQGDVERSEDLLRRMEDMYHVLVTMDYPDAITGNLRRATDVARGIMEKTRGDLSMSLVQRRLHDALDRHTREVLGDGA
ncbi:MAG TPA: haloacid dehalogenase [Actinomycetota bacterium]|nr:haloacid dehalogenase [Actinomycetota bacterium]